MQRKKIRRKTDGEEDEGDAKGREGKGKEKDGGVVSGKADEGS